jgi:hypothetical protein
VKKILALAALASIVGCTDAATSVCIKSQECSGKTNEEAVTECNKDADEEEEEEDACQAEGDAVTACLDANGTCDTVDVLGVEVKGFGLKALADDGACADQVKAAADCAAG